MAVKMISAGHICLDITPVFPPLQKGSSNEGKTIGDLLMPGKLIQMEKADVHTGGSVANTGLALKILGNEVTLLGKIGKDPMGQMVKNILASYGTGGLIEDEKASTSYSVVIAVPGQDRVFLHHPGANDTFSLEDLPEEVLREADLFHFGYPPLMEHMYEQEGEHLLEMFRKVQEYGTITSLDLAAVDPSSKAGQADWKKILQKVLPYVDIFVPSFEELCFMLDKERYERLNHQGDITEDLDLEKEALPLAREILAMGCRVVMIKCGTSGMVYKTAGKEKIAKLSRLPGLKTEAWADQEGIQPCFKADRVLSATGAGDTSIAAFLTAMVKGYAPGWCCRLAAAEGAMCVTAYDALSELSSIETLRERILSGWETYTEIKSTTP